MFHFVNLVKESSLRINNLMKINYNLLIKCNNHQNRRQAFYLQNSKSQSNNSIYIVNF